MLSSRPRSRIKHRPHGLPRTNPSLSHVQSLEGMPTRRRTHLVHLQQHCTSSKAHLTEQQSPPGGKPDGELGMVGADRFLSYRNGSQKALVRLVMLALSQHSTMRRWQALFDATTAAPSNPDIDTPNPDNVVAALTSRILPGVCSTALHGILVGASIELDMTAVPRPRRTNSLLCPACVANKRYSNQRRQTLAEHEKRYREPHLWRLAGDRLGKL